MIDRIKIIVKQIITKGKGLFARTPELSSSDIMKNGEAFFALNVIKNAKDKIIVFDVGANVGGYTKMILEKLTLAQKTNYEVHLFEPQKTCYDKLVNEFNGQNNIIINNFALSDSEGEATIHLDFDGSSWGSMYDRKDLGLDLKKTIQLKKLVDYVKMKGINKIDLLKIDTEGNEMKVLMGCEDFLKPSAVHSIQFEYVGCYTDAGITLRGVAELLMSKGYYVGKLQNSSIEYKAEINSFIEDYTYSNYIASENKIV